MFPNLSALVTTDVNNSTKRQRQERKFEGQTLKFLSLVEALDIVDDDDVARQACVARLRGTVKNLTKFLATTLDATIQIGSATIPLTLDNAKSDIVELSFVGQIPEGEQVSPKMVNLSFIETSNGIKIYDNRVNYDLDRYLPSTEAEQQDGDEPGTPYRSASYEYSDSRWHINVQVTTALAMHDDMIRQFVAEEEEKDMEHSDAPLISDLLKEYSGDITYVKVTITF